MHGIYGKAFCLVQKALQALKLRVVEVNLLRPGWFFEATFEKKLQFSLVQAGDNGLKTTAVDVHVVYLFICTQCGREKLHLPHLYLPDVAFLISFVPGGARVQPCSFTEVRPAARSQKGTVAPGAVFLYRVDLSSFVS